MTTRRRLTLALALVASGAGYAWIVVMDPRDDVARLTILVVTLFAFLGVAYAVTRKGASLRNGTIVLVALAFRLTLVPLGLPFDSADGSLARMLAADLRGEAVTFRRNLLLDDDVWRYLWDARVMAATGNPYRAAPFDPSLDGLDDADGRWAVVRSRVNHPHLATIYPPAAQAAFFAAHLVSAGSVVALKLVLIAADLAAIGGLMRLLALLGRPRSWAILYAWNPLVILMSAGTAHVDVVMVACLTWCAVLLLRGRVYAAGGLMGLAILVKVAPLVLLPLFSRIAGKRGAAAVALVLGVAAAPFLVMNGGGLATFGTFAADWEFNSPLFESLRFLLSGLTNDPGRVARLLLAAGVVLGALAIALRPPSTVLFPARAADTLGILLLGSPTLMPWYATWPLALAVAGRRTAWVALSAIVCLSFPMMVDWKTHAGLLALEAALVAIVVGVVVSRRFRSSAPLHDEPREAGFSAGEEA